MQGLWRRQSLIRNYLGVTTKGVFPTSHVERFTFHYLS